MSGTRFTVLVVHTPVSVAIRCSSDSVVLPSHNPRTHLASARPCLIPSRILALGDAEQCCLRKHHHPTLVRFPETVFERCLLVACHVVPFKQPSSVSYQPRPHIHGGSHFQRETSFQLKTQALNLTFHCVMSSLQLHHFFDCKILVLSQH